MRQFKESLKEVMDERGIKAIDVSKMTGISSGAVSMYLSGKRQPKMETVRKFANALDISELWLLGYDVPHGKEYAQ